MTVRTADADRVAFGKQSSLAILIPDSTSLTTGDGSNRHQKVQRDLLIFGQSEVPAIDTLSLTH